MTTNAFPVRLSVMSFNTWRPFPFDMHIPFQNQLWEHRAKSTEEFLKTFNSDIFCMQELVPETYKEFPKLLPQHDYLSDDTHTKLGENIFWNRNLFELVEFGKLDVSKGLAGDQKDRSEPVVWARLKLKHPTEDLSILVVSAHYRWTGNKEEAETGMAPRLMQARNTYNFVSEKRLPNEAVIVAGDFNCHHHTVRELSGRFTDNIPSLNSGKANDIDESKSSERMQMTDCFEDLHIKPDPTYPTPTALFFSKDASTRGAITYDWIMSNERLKSHAAQVVKFHWDGVFPSDHYPVLAVFDVVKPDID